MGAGLPAAVGYALSKKLKEEEGTVYCLMSDWEQAIGTTHEAALIAKHHKLDNLVVIIDQNDLQAMGHIDDVLEIQPIEKKWDAWGWEWNFVNGHDHTYMDRAFNNVPITRLKPTVHIAYTTKGKGVSFMENNNLFHYKAPSKEEHEEALKELYELA